LNLYDAGDLRHKAARLLAAGAVEVLVGYGPGHGGEGARPVFVRAPEEASNLIWSEDCVHNLATYLSKEPCRGIIRRGGKVGLVAKGCDARAVAVLLSEGQMDRDSVHVIGLVCTGLGMPKCRQCEVQRPALYDTLIGDPSVEEAVEGDPLDEIREIQDKPRKERWAFWEEHLSRCIKCYACRQACPMCYCEQCVTDVTRPQWIDKPSHLRGVLAYHLIRAVHLAGRCVGCGECSRACPAGIPVDAISRYLAYEVEEAFGFKAGMDPEAASVFSSFSEDDPDYFIR
jgi:formate dehydrogenase subunit beta